MIEFKKVFFGQYLDERIKDIGVALKDIEKEKYLALKFEYDCIKLPERKTIDSAGYDFHAPFSFTLKPNETILIPTGIRVFLEPNKWIIKKIMQWLNMGLYLKIVPRSGLGFKYRMQLNNTVGIIDSDYVYSDNEGHIMAKITNDSNEGKTIEIKRGEAFMQGIISPYFKIDNDIATKTRNGGFGSTTK